MFSFTLSDFEFCNKIITLPLIECWRIKRCFKFSHVWE